MKAFIFPLFILFVATSAISSDRYDILVNSDRSMTDQYNPRVAAADSGDFVIIWVDKRNLQSDIYFQLFDSTGIAHGSNRKINDDNVSSPQFEPAADGNRSGQLRAVWKDFRNGNFPFNPDIYFSPIDTSNSADNSNITSEIADVICESPDIALLPNGISIVVWSDYRNGNWDIYGQRVGANSTLIGSNFKVNGDVGVNQQHSPRVAAFEDGGFIVVWYDNRFGNDDIFAQPFDSSAGPVGQNIRVSDDLSGARQAFPDIASDSYGRFYIAWVDWRNGTYPSNPDIYLRRFGNSGSPLGPSKKINVSDGGRPQRDVSLCADRVGNICVVWADSISGQWAIMAQMVDAGGIAVGSNFAVHQNTGEKRLQPDVDTDGYKFFFAWADYRNGNFDIYATVKQYNSPHLIASPNQMEFTMERGGALPAAKTVSLSSVGYGELNWTAIANIDWITVNPSSGVTPDSFQIGISTDTMEYGTYYGSISLVDIDHDDSSEAIDVRLSVTSPLLDLMPDTLFFRSLSQIADPPPDSLRIINAGSGNLTWAADENAVWFDINKLSGNQSEYITVQINDSSLTPGSYIEPLIINSDEAVNSPETAWISLEVVENAPYLAANPDSLKLEGVIGDTLTAQIVIINQSGGQLNWTAVPGDDWILFDRYSGSDNDTIRMAVITSSLSSGQINSEILIYDSSSFNMLIHIPLELILTSGDTVEFIQTNALPQAIGIMPIYVNLHAPSKGGYIPFAYDISKAMLDSIIVNWLNLPLFVDFYTGKGPGGTGRIGFRVKSEMINDSTIPANKYHIADLYFTAGNVECFNLVDTLSDTSRAYILNQSLTKDLPAVIPGNLVIGNPTSVDEQSDRLHPKRIGIGHCYPNPFNAAVTVEIYIPKSHQVSVRIFNILGQEVYCLYDGYLATGTHRFVWKGDLRNSIPAPSGIYFCRLISDSVSDITKLILLK